MGTITTELGDVRRLMKVNCINVCGNCSHVFLKIGKNVCSNSGPIQDNLDVCTDISDISDVMYNSQHLKIRHVLDVMHCEKNLCENILKTLFGMNDSPGSRQDVQDLNIRPEIWLQPPRRQGDQYYMPHAPYILKPVERGEVVAIVSSIRTPTNYVGAIHKRLQDGKLQYMKSHDYHVLMQQVRYSKICRPCTLLRVVAGTDTSNVNIDIGDARWQAHSNTNT